MRPKKTHAPNGRLVGKTDIVGPRRNGCPKNRYASKKVAKQRAIASAKLLNEPIHAYKCPKGCHAWHIGHPIGWRAQQMRDDAQ